MDAIGEKPHWRPPKLSQLTLHHSYKIEDFESLRNVIEEQSTVQLKRDVVFRDGQPSSSCNDGVKTADELLKEAAEIDTTIPPRRPQNTSRILIAPVEGRISREVEFVWYPYLYSEGVHYGKLYIRLYVCKSRF